MARLGDYHLPRYGAPRVLVLTGNRKLASALRREFAAAGCQVDTPRKLTRETISLCSSYNAVVLDAAAVPAPNRNDLLQAARAAAPQCRLALLADPQDAAGSQATPAGCDVVREVPRDDGARAALVREALGEEEKRRESVAVPMDFELLLDTSKQIRRRPAHPGPTPEAIPVEMDFAFLPQDAGRARRGRKAAPSEAVPVAMELNFLRQSSAIGRGQPASRAGGLGVTALLLGFLVLLPMLWTESLELDELARTQLLLQPVAPPPPPPPPASQQAASRARTPQPLPQALVLPTAIPKTVKMISTAEEAPPVEGGFGVVGGVPGGVPGGTSGGILGGVLGGMPSPAPPPAASAPTGPVRIGGELRRPRLVKHVLPKYPPTARRARLQGDVQIDAVVDVNGRVVEMQVVQGHPLLAQAAMQAVSQWVYEPTYLNNVAIPVAFTITVHFSLD